MVAQKTPRGIATYLISSRMWQLKCSRAPEWWGASGCFDEVLKRRKDLRHSTAQPYFAEVNSELLTSLVRKDSEREITTSSHLRGTMFLLVVAVVVLMQDLGNIRCICVEIVL